VLSAEYTSDRETSTRFGSADDSAGITGALFSVSLDGNGADGHPAAHARDADGRTPTPRMRCTAGTAAPMCRAVRDAARIYGVMTVSPGG
jgi:hypothetical protein